MLILFQKSSMKNFKNDLCREQGLALGKHGPGFALTDLAVPENSVGGGALFSKKVIS